MQSWAGPETYSRYVSVPEQKQDLVGMKRVMRVELEQEVDGTGNLCRFGGHHGSKQKALIPGSELFVLFWKHFNPVYWIERLQMIS